MGIKKRNKAASTFDLSGRRIVTVLFCEVVGSTALCEQLDPKTWTEIMKDVFERINAAV